MNDRLIQLVALILLGGGIIGAFMLTPAINQERVDRQLTYDIEVGDDANAMYTLGASLGSFRGVMVNVLWQRAEELKQEGKFFEANNLAEMITTLQPRYPEAWNFHGWNMAYNISVKCKTAEERWDWVQKGMALLRDRGIPNNPNAIVLYRSLAWTLGHKMAGATDDMQWYYKERWAETWQTILGIPDPRQRFKDAYAENPPAQDKIEPLKHFDYAATDRLRSIAGYADTYLLRPGRVEDKLTYNTAGAKRDKANQPGQEKKDTRDYNASNYFDTLSPDAKAQFFSDHPDLRQIVQEWESLAGPSGEELDLGMNTKTLRALGRIMLYRDAGYPINNPAVISPETVGVEGVAIKQWLDAKQRTDVLIMVPFVDVEGIRGEVKQQNPKASVIDLMPMLDLLRAQTIIADYHMDPAYMAACMEEFGPLDWRHPSAHSVYWAALGTRRAKQWENNKERIDFINANRAIFHGLQNLSHNGKISFRPKCEALGAFGESLIHEAADTRMIPAYEKAVTETREMFERGEFGDKHDTSTYERGHENFLQSAVVLYYFEGNEFLARKYYKKAQDKYGNSPESAVAQAGDYKLQLKDFARARMEDELGFEIREMILFFIDQAWRRGITSRDAGVMQRYFSAGKEAYDGFLAERQTTSRNDADVKGRQDLEPFDVLVRISFLRFMTDPGFTLQQKSAIWRQGASLLAGVDAEQPVLLVAYMQMYPMLAQQAQVEGWGEDWTVMFPEPRGYREWFQQLQQSQPAPIRPGS